ncbi:MAG TPA: galactose-1-phosphate uridylyltransferase [Thermodesulfobacteriota bacterium]|nr:galactose-1-phosphate uridylyltransferase [Thermodesulfobacteriota bacterium]
MREFRKDPILGTWVIIATERWERPSDWAHEQRGAQGGFCPLCEGNEDKTPPEVFALRNGTPPNSRGWKLRVVPNKFPALQIEGDLEKQGQGIYDRMNGIGAHEVIVETSLHQETLATLSVEAVRNVLWAYRERIVDLKRDRRFRYMMVFKNHGSAAGASLEHSHSQIVALPIVPKRVKEEAERTRDYFRQKDRCVFCDMIRQEMKERDRVVCDNQTFVSLAPFASRFPYETWLLPKGHFSSFEQMQMDEYESAARVLAETLRRMDRDLNRPPYNYILHTTPFQGNEEEHYHWHLEIMPKLTKMAGFEWGTGFYINPVRPEEAAERMREEESSGATPPAFPS